MTLSALSFVGSLFSAASSAFSVPETALTRAPAAAVVVPLGEDSFDEGDPEGDDSEVVLVEGGGGASLLLLVTGLFFVKSLQLRSGS